MGIIKIEWTHQGRVASYREISPLYITGYVDGTRFSCLPQASALPLLKALRA